MVTAVSRHNHFWFGTENRMEWFPTPLSGADVSPQGWESNDTFLNGGGFQLNSFGSHRRYSFEWKGASSRRVAQLMRSYADGSYGRGLIYFIDPLTWDTNLFPAMWADPSIGIGNEGASLVYGVDPIAMPTSNWQVNDYPVTSAYYNLANVTSGWRGKEEAVFIPIPEGSYLLFGAAHTFTGSGRILYRTQSPSGALGPVLSLTSLTPSSQNLVSANVPYGPASAGIWVWVGRNASTAGTVTISGMTARIQVPGYKAPSIEGPWIGGQGHSGCRFLGKPTYIENTGVDGGQVGFAASFTEVGSWIYG